MYATVRRSEGIDKVRSAEGTRKVKESLLQSLSQLRGFGGYYLIDAGEGVVTSVSLFANAEQAHESTRTAARWVREPKLESALTNSPKITAGRVIARGRWQAPSLTAVPRSRRAFRTRERACV
jgi:hypothetical protein